LALRIFDDQEKAIFYRFGNFLSRAQINSMSPVFFIKFEDFIHIIVGTFGGPSYAGYAVEWSLHYKFHFPALVAFHS